MPIIDKAVDRVWQDESIIIGDAATLDDMKQVKGRLKNHFEAYRKEVLEETIGDIKDAISETFGCIDEDVVYAGEYNCGRCKEAGYPDPGHTVRTADQQSNKKFYDECKTRIICEVIDKVLKGE